MSGFFTIWNRPVAVFLDSFGKEHFHSHTQGQPHFTKVQYAMCLLVCPSKGANETYIIITLIQQLFVFLLYPCEFFSYLRLVC